MSISKFQIGGKSVNLGDVMALTVGGYPSPHWKVQYRVPPKSLRGPVTFELTGVNNVGNALAVLSEAGVDGSVVVE